MNIAVIGAGYVGLVTCASFAEIGNSVTCVDVDSQKIANLKKNILPIYEANLPTILESNVLRGRLHFATALQFTHDHPEVIFIAVDTLHVKQAAIAIGQYLKKYAVIVVKSTVPIGMTESLEKIIQIELDKRQVTNTFDIVSNPEFLREGTALTDFMQPDRVIIGLHSEKVKHILLNLYLPIVADPNKIYFMGFKEAEMTKYAANAMLAARISFINEIALLCEQLHVDVESVRKGIGSDKRIGDLFIYPGCGYGGSCFPKDLKMLIQIAEERGINPFMLQAIETRNNLQKRVLVDKILARFGTDLSAITIGVWGLSFKPDTDDMREAPSLTILKDLIAYDATILAYDPKAMPKAQMLFPEEWLAKESIRLVEDQYAALENVDALILITEWHSFCTPDLELMKKRMRGRAIFDGRNQYDPMHLMGAGFEYFGIGQKNTINSHSHLIPAY